MLERRLIGRSGSLLSSRRGSSRKENETFELIPHTKLEKALPRALIVDYTQWYDTKTGVIDLRLLSRPWQSNLRESWSTDVPFHDQVAFGCHQEGGSRRFIVDQNHPVARVIHKIFAPFESCVHNLLISFKASFSSNWKPQELHTFLPRYESNFVPPNKVFSTVSVITALSSIVMKTLGRLTDSKPN